MQLLIDLHCHSRFSADGVAEPEALVSEARAKGLHGFAITDHNTCACVDYFEQHGFLNLLLATDALLAGGTEQDARQLLAVRDGRDVAARVLALGGARVAAARAAFSSFGTCSITEPLEDLIRLGLLAAPAADGSRQ